MTIVKDGVDDTARELFDDSEEQESFRRGLIDQDWASWPLVNGTYPGDLVAVACGWVAPLLAAVDEGGRVPAVRTDHPWVEAVSTAIMGRLQHWALRGDSPVTPMWQAFLTETETAEVFDASKIPPRLEELRGESLFDILQFKYRAVQFVTGGLHDREAAAALAWVRDGDGVQGIAVGVITGAAGTGKSRLAAEVCDRLVASVPEWQAGFADYAALPEAGVPQRPMLLVCDYPERHPDRVGDFLARLWRHYREGRLAVPVRVLLVSRHRETWWEPVRARCRNLEDLVHHRVDLAPARLDADELDRHVAQAFDDFCDGFGVPKVWRQDLSIELVGADRPLLVHIAALLAAHGLAHISPGQVADQSPACTSGSEALLDDLITAEVDRLRGVPFDEDRDRGGAVFTTAAQVREALCLTTLTAPSRCDLPDLLACTEAFGPNGTGNRVTVAERMLDAFPATAQDRPEDRSLWSVAPVEPDLVAAHLLARTPGRSTLVKRLVASATVTERPAYHAQLVSALALATEDYPEIGTDLKQHLADSLAALIGAGKATAEPLGTLLAERLVALVKAAVAQAAEQDLTAARQLTTAISLPDLVSDQRIDQIATEALWVLPYPHPALTGLGAALAARALTHHEREPDADRAALAATCGQLGNWLGAHGQRLEALIVTERARGFYEELAEANRAAYLPALASSVSNLAVRLGEVGRRAEALAAAERAVAMREELAEGNRTAYLPALAGSVNNLAGRLSEAGRGVEALAAAERAVAMREELVEGNRAAYLPDLATSVWMAAYVRHALGIERDVALDYCDRAIGYYQGLSEAEPDAFSDTLAAVEALRQTLVEQCDEPA